MENGDDAFHLLKKMKKILFLCLISGMIWAKPPKKNILIFLVDDLGWQDVSVPFAGQKTPWNSLYRTPNLEKLAAKGVKFTHAYANQNCTPTRVSLLTGMNSLHHHVSSWTFQKDENPKEGGNPNFEVPAWNMNGLVNVAGYPNSIQATSIATVLANHGYLTVHAGKAHFGAYNTPAADPINNGFQMNVGGTAAGQPASYSGLQNFGNSTQGPSNIRAVPHLERYWGKDIHLTEALTQETMRRLDSARRADQPFFLLFSNYAVHTPIQADSRFVQPYFDLGLDSTEAKYASLIEGMDKSLGDWMGYLDQHHLTENTVILFLSDNGGLTDVGRGIKGRNTYNTPLRSGKTSGYEGGLRIPLVISGLPSKRKTVDENVMVDDIFPTILDMIGIKSTEAMQKIDGESMLGPLAGKKSKSDRYLTWHYPHMRTNGSPDIQPFSAIRQGDWKLLFFHQDQHFEMYNTREDLSEKNNLFSTESARAMKLAKELGQRLRSSQSKMLIQRSTKSEIVYPY